MFKIEYVVFKKDPLKVAATFFTEQEALMYTLAQILPYSSVPNRNRTALTKRAISQILPYFFH